MPRKSVNSYPPDWKAIATRIKDEAGWRCVRCKHWHDPTTGHTLTVHHLDLDPANCEWWNLAALCQRCHLQIQAKIVLEQMWPFEHSEWFKPYAAGWYAYRYLGQQLSREETMQRLDELLALECAVQEEAQRLD